LNCFGFLEITAFIFLVSVLADSACGQLLKLIPVIHNLVATCPPLLEIVEDRLSWMEKASSLYILFMLKVLEASVTPAPHLSLFTH
jgi:hypothetical protein